ncbi:hemin-degrading factor [Candidimonas humi]|uniref:Hemin-degrading factor n=1 Tax=Candidimonas humi TaxID=683355 RepID=A0ABV8NW49_9BURK|nr:ChuX/HutX family heme-like substrate-binding protein [Candidimonas humi]
MEPFEQQGRVLRERYAELAAAAPKARIRNLAAQMHVSELELVLAGCGGISPRMLREPPQDVFRRLGELGRVMALTRNEWCVHERHGRYEDIRAGKSMGIVLGPDIDLRMFFSHWKYTVAVDDGQRRSLQFFDAQGEAVHKVYCTDASDVQAYEALASSLLDPEPAWPQLAQAAGMGRPAQGVAAAVGVDTDAMSAADADADVAGADAAGVAATEAGAPMPVPDKIEPAAGLRNEWLAMKDTHEFAGLLKRHKLSRLAALREAGTDLAQPVPNDTIERMLHAVVERGTSIMCFVGNCGMVQIHSGPIEHLLRTGPWFNVLEPHFNLHLDTTAIESTWIVNRPSDDGWITSLEGYTAGGELIVQFFGARKPGIPELAAWRELMVGYCPVPLAA